MLASCGARKFNAAGHNSVAIADKEKPRMSGAFFSAAGERPIRTVVYTKLTTRSHDINKISLIYNSLETTKETNLSTSLSKWRE